MRKATTSVSSSRSSAACGARVSVMRASVGSVNAGWLTLGGSTLGAERGCCTLIGSALGGVGGSERGGSAGGGCVLGWSALGGVGVLTVGLDAVVAPEHRVVLDHHPVAGRLFVAVEPLLHLLEP